MNCSICHAAAGTYELEYDNIDGHRVFGARLGLCEKHQQASVLDFVTNTLAHVRRIAPPSGEEPVTAWRLLVDGVESDHGAVVDGSCTHDAPPTRQEPEPAPEENLDGQPEPEPDEPEPEEPALEPEPVVIEGDVP